MKITYMHLKLGKGRATAAIQVEDNKASAGIAFCSPKDQFCKKTGRLIAGGRLNKNKLFCEFTVDPEQTLQQQLFDAINATPVGALKPQWTL